MVAATDSGSVTGGRDTQGWPGLAAKGEHVGAGDIVGS